MKLKENEKKRVLGFLDFSRELMSMRDKSGRDARSCKGFCTFSDLQAMDRKYVSFGVGDCFKLRVTKPPAGEHGKESALFDTLYDHIKSRGDETLIVARGMVTDDMDKDIRIPVLTVRASASFDAVKNTVEITARPYSVKIDIGSMPESFDPAALAGAAKAAGEIEEITGSAAGYLLSGFVNACTRDDRYRLDPEAAIYIARDTAGRKKYLDLIRKQVVEDGACGSAFAAILGITKADKKDEKDMTAESPAPSGLLTGPADKYQKILIRKSFEDDLTAPVGPPGCGKTSAGKHMIIDHIAAGENVLFTAYDGEPVRALTDLMPGWLREISAVIEAGKGMEQVVPVINNIQILHGKYKDLTEEDWKRRESELRMFIANIEKRIVEADERFKAERADIERRAEKAYELGNELLKAVNDLRHEFGKEEIKALLNAKTEALPDPEAFKGVLGEASDPEIGEFIDLVKLAASDSEFMEAASEERSGKWHRLMECASRYASAKGDTQAAGYFIRERIAKERLASAWKRAAGSDLPEDRDTANDELNKIGKALSFKARASRVTDMTGIGGLDDPARAAEFIPVLEKAASLAAEQNAARLLAEQAEKLAPATETLRGCLTAEQYSLLAKSLGSVTAYEKAYKEVVRPTASRKAEYEEKAARVRSIEEELSGLRTCDGIASTERGAALETQLYDRYSELAELVITRAIVERLNSSPEVNGKLEAFKKVVKSIGKGTGKRAVRLMNGMKESFTEIQKIVPLWIMTSDQALEMTVPGTFDLVIADEASELDITWIPVLAAADRAVVLGDDEQVEALNVGVDTGQIAALQDRYLREVPNRFLFDLSLSVFDAAQLSSAGRSVTLLHHYRSNERLIGFSNEECYEGRLIAAGCPVTGPDTVPLLPVFVGGSVNGKRNEEEAEEAVTRLKDLLKEHAHDDKSIGIIAMGTDQAALIRKKVKVFIPMAQAEKHRLLVAGAADFQGQERDIIILSMTEAPEEGKQLRLRDGKDATRWYRKRLNVAMSRAKEKLIVLHSFAPADLKDGDIRLRLLNYLYKETEREKFELNGFEKDVKCALEHGEFDEKGWLYTGIFVNGMRIPLLCIEDNGRPVVIDCAREGGAETAERLRRAGYTVKVIDPAEFYLRRKEA